MSWKLIKSIWDEESGVFKPILSQSNRFVCVHGKLCTCVCVWESDIENSERIFPFSLTLQPNAKYLILFRKFGQIIHPKLRVLYFVLTNRIEQATKFTPSSIIRRCSVGHQICAPYFEKLLSKGISDGCELIRGICYIKSIHLKSIFTFDLVDILHSEKASTEHWKDHETSLNQEHMLSHPLPFYLAHLLIDRRLFWVFLLLVHCGYCGIFFIGETMLYSVRCARDVQYMENSSAKSCFHFINAIQNGL